MLKQRVTLIASVAILGLASACRTVATKPAFPPQPEAVGETSALPQTPTPGQQRTPARQVHPNSATTALVEKARGEASSGNFVAAYATLERAQHIDPQNPLIFVQMGQVKLQEGNAVQAGNLGAKARQLASGDPASQSLAWRLIAESLKAQGKDPDAADAQRQADRLAPR
jgi:hypothetical protein